MARYKSTARDLGAFICFEGEAGQGPEAARGTDLGAARLRPVVRVRGAGGGRVSIAGVACYRPHLIDGCLAATGLRIEPW